MLQSKVAIVLGAAGDGNMGQIIARRLAGEGAKVVLGVTRMAAIAEEIGTMLRERDITDRAQGFGVVDHAMKTFGKVDIGVNATGCGCRGPSRIPQRPISTRCWRSSSRARSSSRRSSASWEQADRSSRSPRRRPR